MTRLNRTSKLSIVGLNADCLFHVFSYLQLPDLLNLRLQCSTFNDAVCKYFPQITKLSIVYTEHGSKRIPSKNLNKNLDKKKLKVGDTYFHSDWLFTYLPDFAGKFTWRKDLIVIFGRKKYDKFLKFVKKYKIHNITKLAIIVDPKPLENVTLSEASDLLKLCPKVETLFLERADRWKFQSYAPLVFKAEDLGDLFGTITKLVFLSELHFFTCPHSFSMILLTPDDTMKPSTIPDDQVNQMFGNFLSAMLQKLRIFGFDHSKRAELSQALAPLLKQNFENILELEFQEDDLKQLVDSGTKFNNLRSLTLFGGGCEFEKFNFGNSFEMLTTLRFGGTFYLVEQSMRTLNTLPRLEKLSADSLIAQLPYYKQDDFPRNRTIKHIEVEGVEEPWGDDDPSDDIECPYPFTCFFQALETVTIMPAKGGKFVLGQNKFHLIRIASVFK